MKLITRLGLVAVPIALMALVLITGIGGVVNAAVGEYDCYCTQPQLSLAQENAYWGSYADFAGRNLSVAYHISNNSTNYANAHNLQIVGTINTAGVTLVDNGRDVNMVSAGECELLTVKYNVPEGVTAFRNNVYATTSDQCGTPYSYPEPMP